MKEVAIFQDLPWMTFCGTLSSVNRQKFSKNCLVTNTSLNIVQPLNTSHCQVLSLKNPSNTVYNVLLWQPETQMFLLNCISSVTTCVGVNCWKNICK